jgi:hypothetical protein
MGPTFGAGKISTKDTTTRLLVEPLVFIEADVKMLSS